MEYGTARLGALAVGGFALGAFVVGLLIFCLPILVLIVVGRWKMYKKAGKKGWEAIVPIYSDWVYVEVSGLEWWWFFALFVIYLGAFSHHETMNDAYTFVNFRSLIHLFGLFVCNYNISKKLHKDTGFAVLMTLFPFVMLPIVAFSDKYKWDDSVKVSKNGPFDDKNTGEDKKEESKNKKDEKEVRFCPHCGAKLEKNSKFCSKCGKEI